MGFTRIQRVGAVFIGILLLLVGLQAFWLAEDREVTLRSIAGSDDVTGNIFFTQRESLVLSINVERWMSGFETKRNVLIRRALLAQRLNVRDEEGVSNGSRAHPEYLSALATIDGCLASAPDGLLPLEFQTQTRSRCGNAVDVLVFESRQLAIEISGRGDERVRTIIAQADSRQRNLVTRVAVLLLSIAVVGSFLGYSRARTIRRARVAVLDDERRLSEANVSLQHLESEMNERIREETALREENQRLDSAVLMVTTQLRSSMTTRQVVEKLASGLDHLVKTDLIYILIFGRGRESDVSCLVRGGRSEFIDTSQFGVDGRISNEIVRILDDIGNQENRGILKGSDILRESTPALAAILHQLSMPDNSIVFGIREGNEVSGAVLVGRNNLLSWSSNELGAIQNVVANAANAVGAIHSSDLVREVRKTELVVSELREIDRLKDEFISNVNHELRTPLTSIIGYLDIILDSASDIPEETLTYLDTVRRNADRLLVLIEDLLLTSRAEDPRNILKKEELDFTLVVADAVEMLKKRDPHSTVSIEYESDTPQIRMQGDRTHLTQVIVNLVTNAVKFSRPRSAVRVETRVVHQSSDGAHVELLVSDSGIGIPAAEVPRLFQRFFRGSNAEKELIPGTGLGLPIVKQFVENHGGTISIDSTENVGTTVTVRLPLGNQTP